MFTDGRSRKVVFLAHCLLNQNAISDGTACYPAAHEDIVRACLDAQVGVIQLPCPELCCLGLDRGDPQGAERPVTVENTRIRSRMEAEPAAACLDALVEHVLFQIDQYQQHGFVVLGIVGVNRSPCCGVDTTSREERETPGRGVFLGALETALAQRGVALPLLGVKATAEAVAQVRALFMAE